jgi:hypothetical protein
MNNFVYGNSTQFFDVLLKSSPKVGAKGLLDFYGTN